MDPSVLLALLLVSLPLGYLVWAALSVDRKSHRAIRELLAAGTETAEFTEVQRISLLERIEVREFLERMAAEFQPIESWMPWT